MMKKNAMLLVLSLVLCCNTLSAQRSYTVENIPNTRLESDRNHLSNPDLIIDKTTEMRLDSLLSRFRDTADVFVVAVKSIDGDDINGFSNNLFNKWGIGDRDKDNGVLVMFVEDIRKVRFEVGYGLEPTLTDVLCKRIQERSMIPLFKEGKYSEGIYAGVENIHGVISGDQELVADLNTEPDYTMVLLVVLGAINFIALVIGIVKLCLEAKYMSTYKRKMDDLKDYGFKFLALTIFFQALLPLSIFCFLARLHTKRKQFRCAKCGEKMAKVRPGDNGKYLDGNQIKQENKGIYTYHIWHCDGCGENKIESETGSCYSEYSFCENCKLVGVKAVSRKTLKKATKDSKGKSLVTYKCVLCGFTYTREEDIPQLIDTSYYKGMGYDGDSMDSASSYDGGGSFGGGHSGGGGATSSW